MLIAAAEQFSVDILQQPICSRIFTPKGHTWITIWSVTSLWSTRCPSLFFCCCVEVLSSTLGPWLGAMPRARSELGLVQKSPSAQEHHQLCSLLAPHQTSLLQSFWSDEATAAVPLATVWNGTVTQSKTEEDDHPKSQALNADFITETRRNPVQKRTLDLQKQRQKVLWKVFTTESYNIFVSPKITWKSHIYLMKIF